MVALSVIHASNARIAAALSVATTATTTPIVAVFVGATSGIGKSSLLQFAKHTAQLKPHIYLVGRSQAAADEILQQLQRINAEGEHVFIKADVSLLRQVDEVCKQIKDKESTLNVLFLSQGTLDMTTETTENLTTIMALSYYSRMRFIANLLPLLEAAGTAAMLSRVVSVMAGTKEGRINPADIPRKRVALWKSRGHLCSMMTLTMEHFAGVARSSSVSFVHSYPGSVDTGLGRTMTGFMGGAMKVVFVLARPMLKRIPLEESGDRHVFLATSSRYAASEHQQEEQSSGVTVDGLDTAVGSTGQVGSGVYSVDETGESAGTPVVRLLAEMRQNGVKEKVWQHLQDEFVRITGTATN